jgi:hypothetical protein
MHAMQDLKESMAFFGSNPDLKRGTPITIWPSPTGNSARDRSVATGSVKELCSAQLSGDAERMVCRTDGDNILLRKDSSLCVFRWRPASWVETP